MRHGVFIGLVLVAGRGVAAVFAPVDGYFGVSLPYVPPPSALNLRVDGDALTPLLEAPTNRTFVARPSDPKLGAAADYFRQGNLALAAVEMENLRRSTPPALWSRMPLADVYYEIGWYQQAIDFSEQALAFNPDLEDARRVFVASLIASGRKEQAAEEATKYAEMRRDEPVAQYLLAYAQFAGGHLDEALGAVNSSLLMDKARPEVWLLKAQILLEAKRPRDAVDAALQCRNMQGAHLAVTLLLGRAFQQLNDRKQAEVFFREAARLNPPPLEALTALADFLEHSNPAEATETMEKAAEAYPNVAEVHAHLARLYGASLRGAEHAREKSAAAFLEGRVDDSLEAALDAIAADATQPVNYVNASALLQRRGELKASAAMAEQAHALFPNDVAAAIRLAQVMAAQKNTAAAIHVLERDDGGSKRSCGEIRTRKVAGGDRAA